MTTYDKPSTELPAAQPSGKATVSGFRLTGYNVIDSETGQYIAGPFEHWADAFRRAGQEGHVDGS